MAAESGEGAVTSHVDEDQKDIILYDIQLATLQRKAVPGVQSFPFSLVVPPGLAPSMQVLRRYISCDAIKTCRSIRESKTLCMRI